MYTIEDFKEWLQEICSRKSFQDVIKVVQDEGECEGKNGHHERRFRVRIYTGNNCYSIIVIERAEGKKSYLGCGASTRKPRAGEDWVRGNDLPDGKLSPETWQKIKNAIISYELVKTAKKTKMGVKDCAEKESS